MDFSILYCFVVNAANITFLQIDPDSELIPRADCSPPLTTNSNPCSEDLDATSLRVDGEVRPLFMKRSVKTHHLEHLEALCYPSVHIWCWIRSPFVLIPKHCDGFIIATEVQLESVFDDLSSSRLKAFTAHENFQSCNAQGILEPGRVHESVRGLALKYVGMDVPVFTKPLSPATSSSTATSKHTQGIERSVVEVLRERHNFTLVPLRPSVPMHFKFKSPENERDWLEQSSIGHVIRKRAFLIFGDFSLVHPRQHFVDFTAPHLSEGFTLMVKASLRSLSARDILFACGPRLFTLYAFSAAVFSIAVYVQAPASERRIELFFYFGTLLVQQSNPPVFRFRRMTRTLDKIWRFSLFALGCWLSARLVESLARGHIDGLKKGNLADLARFLTLNRDARVFHDPRALFLDDVQTRSDEIVLERSEQCFKCIAPFLNSRVAFMLAELSINQGLFRMYMRDKSVYILEEPIFFFYLAFGVPKRCFFRRDLDVGLRILFEAGHIERFRRRADLETRTSVPAKLRRDFALRKSSNFLYDLLPWLLLTPAMVFVIEALVRRRRSRHQARISEGFVEDSELRCHARNRLQLPHG